MNRPIKMLLTVIFCAAIVGISACSTTTTHRLGPSQAALSHHEIGMGDAVLIRYVNEGDSRSSSRSEIVQISNVSDFGITGVSESGNAVNIAFSEIFQIEYKDVGPVQHDSPAVMAAGKAAEVTSKVLLGALYIYVNALGGGG